MTTLDDYLGLIQDELGLAVTAEQLDNPFDQIPDWDSVKLLWLATALEKATGRQVPFANLLEATSLEDIYRLAVAV